MKAERSCPLTVDSLCSAGAQLLAFSGCFIVLLSSNLAAQVTLRWNTSDDPAVAGYTLYYGSASREYEAAIDVGMQDTYTLPDLDDGQPYFFAIAPYDIHGNEREISDEIVHDRLMVDSEADQEADSLIDDEKGNADEGGSTDDEVTRISDVDGGNDHSSDQVDGTGAQEEQTEAASAASVVPQSQLSIVFVDSEPFVGDGAAEATIDGRPETFWRTEMGTKAPRHPHELVIALGHEYSVRGFRYLPRQDGSLEGMVARFSFYVSEDGEDWGKAVATGVFSRDAAEKEVIFPEHMGSFVRLVAHSEVNGKPWTSVAEITVLRTP